MVAARNRSVCRAICFVLLFLFLWFVLQYVLAYKWTDSAEMLHDRYRHFEAEPAGTIEVLYMGTSSMDGGVNPAIVYDEAGITGYNFSTGCGSAFCAYYALRYALLHQTPRLVVLDLSDIHQTRDPRQLTFNEITYRKSIENMPDLRLRLEMLKDYQRLFGMGDMLEYFLPLLRYHSRWSELTVRDFLPGAFSSPDYQPYLKGCEVLTTTEDQSDKPIISQSDIIDGPSQISLAYYSMILSLCRENSIEVMVTLAPQLKLDSAYLEHALAFCEENSLPILYYPDLESIHAIGIDEQSCYQNAAHLNMYGQWAYSRALAREMASLYDLEDHRMDPAYASWDEAYDLYWQEYGGKISAHF